MNSIELFGITFNVDPVAFTIPIGGGWNIYWYAIFIASGFLLAVIYGLRRAKTFGIDPDRLLNGILVTAIMAVLSGRLYYVIFSPTLGLGDFLKIHDGGMAIPGAMIGAVVFAAIMCRLLKMNLPSVLDLTALGFLIGQCIGRWGNFVNQEAYGGFTGSDFFGMTGNVISSQMGSDALVHPCFLYESVWCFLGFWLLHWLSFRRKFNGELCCVYMIWYGFGRAVIEGLRTDALMLGNLRVTQMLMVLVCIAGAVLLVVGLKRAADKQKEENFAPAFETAGDEASVAAGETVISAGESPAVEGTLPDNADSGADDSKPKTDAQNE